MRYKPNPVEHGDEISTIIKDKKGNAQHLLIFEFR